MFYSRVFGPDRIRESEALPRTSMAAAAAVVVCAYAWSNPAYSASDAGEGVCSRISQAMLKTAETPYSSVSMITLDQAGAGEDKKPVTSRSSETIFTGSALFVRSGGGRWRKIGVEISDLQKMVREASAKLDHCQDLGGDKIEGASVSVLSAEEGPKTNSTSTKQWVDKDRGVLVRSETHTSTKEGSRHSVIQYKYGSVAAPQL